MEKELSWDILEHIQYKRSFRWYVIASVFILVLLIYTVITGNFLFSVIIILGILLNIATSWHTPNKITFKLEEEGVRIDTMFYTWDRFDSYWIVPEDENINLGLDLKNWLKSDLYIQINKYSPEYVEKFVARFLKKNPERNDEPLSYLLARKLKL